MNHPDPEALGDLRLHQARIGRCIHGAVQQFIEQHATLRHEYSPRTEASIIHDLMISHARREFDSVPGITTPVLHGLFVVNINDAIAVRFKKFDKALQPKNIPTQQSIGYLWQQLPLPGMPPEATKLHAGYVFNKLRTGADRVLITCMNGRAVRWVIDLADDLGREIVRIEPAMPDVPPAKRRPQLKSPDGDVKRMGDNGSESKQSGDSGGAQSG